MNRLRYILVLAALAICSLGTFAQTDAGWKDRKVTLRVSNETMGDILVKLARQAGADVVFEGVTIEGINEPTTLNVKDMPLDKAVLRLIGDQPVSVNYETAGRIVFRPLAEDAAAQAEDAAQYHPVSAVVTSMEDGEPIVGAMVMITDGGKNGRSGGVTDSNGKFSLRVPNNASVRISCIGYASQSFQVKQPMLNEKVVLEPNRTEEEKAVVTGMSKRSMTSFTGNFVSVKGEELRRMNPNNILEGLQFFDPSFKIVENNTTGSDPNATPQFNIRGDQTLGNNVDLNSMDLLLDNVSSRPNTPLFVLDGFIVPLRRILELDPQRVENITILKDASATAIYGSRASNGVVVVETKVAPDGALSVTYNGSLTIQSPDLTGYNMMNASQKLAMEKMAGVYNENDPYQMNTYNKYLRNILAGVDTYWLSQPLRTAVQTRHTLTAAGGTDKFRYNLGLNAGFMPGVMKGSQNDTKGVTFSMSYRKDKFTVGADINLSETNGKNSPYGSFSSYTQANPYYPMKNAEGGYDLILDNHTGTGSVLITNPLYNATTGVKDISRNTTIATTMNIEYRLLPNLRFTEQLSYTRGMARTEVFYPADHTMFATETDLTKKGSYSKNTGEMTSWSSNLGVNWNAPVGKHLFCLFGNWTVNEDRNNYVNLYATGFPDRHMDDFIFGYTMSTNPTGTEALSRAMGLITQFSYSYDNRYSFDFNLSAENSSRYGDDHSMTPFWSTGVRWNAYREKFLQGRVSNLVFRANYGVTGEQNYNPYQAIEFYTYSQTMKPYTSFTTLGAMLAGLNNTELGWAKTHNLSLGVDIGFWKNRINATFNYYNNITKQLLIEYDLAPSTGFRSQVMNAGELQNRGFDITLNVIALQNVKKQLYWTISANANHNRNKIRKISDYLRKLNEAQLATAGAPLPVYQEGQSTSTLYTVRSLGIDPVTGQEVYLKRDGTKTFTWDAADKVPVGHTTPDVSGTISSSLSWRDFTATVGFTYHWGGVQYNQTLVDKLENRSIAFNMDERAAENRWTTPGDVAMYRPIDPAGSQTPQSSRFIMDDNELKCSTISLGYRFSSNRYKFLRPLSIDMASLSFTTNELFRLSSIKMERGLDYPFARSFTFSLNIIFK